MVDDVRNFLFGPPGAGGFDLASLNIQRGRDHGLPSYNEARQAFGLGAATSFADISRDPAVQARLASVYDDVDQVDLWVGGLSEDKMRRGHLGPLFTRILAEQFEALRDGDPYYWRLTMDGALARRIARTKLSTIIRRNTGIGRELQRNVFRVRGWHKSSN